MSYRDSVGEICPAVLWNVPKGVPHWLNVTGWKNTDSGMSTIECVFNIVQHCKFENSLNIK